MFLTVQLYDRDDEICDGKPTQLPTLTFDARQYRDEVTQAALDFSWDTPIRRIARLVKDALEGRPQIFTRLGLSLDWVAPSSRRNDEVVVSLNDSEHRYVKRPIGQLFMAFSSTPGSPDQQAEAIISKIMATNLESWARKYRHVLPKPPDH